MLCNYAKFTYNQAVKYTPGPQPCAGPWLDLGPLSKMLIHKANAT